MPRRNSIDLSVTSSTASGPKLKLYIVYGTQNGTSQRAASLIKSEVKKHLEQAHGLPDVTIVTFLGNDLPPEKLAHRISRSFMSIFVTPTYDQADGCCFPRNMRDFWQYLTGPQCKSHETFAKVRFAVFGLGSRMYAAFDEPLFNRAGKSLDKKLHELGGSRMIRVGLGDEMHARNYLGELEKWIDKLAPKIVHEMEAVGSENHRQVEESGIVHGSAKMKKRTSRTEKSAKKEDSPKKSHHEYKLAGLPLKEGRKQPAVPNAVNEGRLEAVNDDGHMFFC